MSRVVFFLLIFFFSVALVSAQTAVKGKVTGADGKPMAMAHVFLSQPEDIKSVKSVAAGQDGQFNITIDSTGVWMLQFTGVGHRDHRVALFIDRPQMISIDVELAGYRYLPDFSQAKIVGDFNRWYVLSAVPMRKQPDRTYAAEIETKADTVAYRLNGVRDGDAVEGTQADRYACNGSGGYISIMDAKGGKVRIVFDPGKLVRSDKPARVTFAHTPSVVSNFARIYDEMQHYQDMYQAAFRDFLRSRGNRKEFKFDWLGPLSSIEQQLKKETNAVLRKGLCISYLTIAMIAREADASIYSTCLEEISPTSTVWSLNPHSIHFALGHSGFTEEQRDMYVQQVIEGNPDDRTKAALLFDEFMAAQLSDQQEKANRCYDILVRRYGNTPEAKMIRERYAPKDALRVGKPVPAFSVVSMDDPTKTISSESLKGSYYLMTFWAATNEPSIREMPGLQKAYEKYSRKKFTILSLSLDRSRQDVMRFRQGTWKMAWLNAYLGKDIYNKVVTDFQVVDIPRAFLVDPKGNLVAMGKEVLGVYLEKTLAKHLGK